MLGEMKHEMVITGIRPQRIGAVFVANFLVLREKFDNQSVDTEEMSS
jgi:hypothetical protein